MASINNRVFRTIGSPLILPKHHTCVLRPLRNSKLNISLDHNAKEYTNIHSIECRVSKEKIRFARYRAFPFWSRGRGSFVTEVERYDQKAYKCNNSGTANSILCTHRSWAVPTFIKKAESNRWWNPSKWCGKNGSIYIANR